MTLPPAHVRRNCIQIHAPDLQAFGLLMAIDVHLGGTAGKDRCWAKPETLIPLSHLSRTTFYAVAKRLEEAGILIRDERGWGIDFDVLAVRHTDKKSATRTVEKVQVVRRADEKVRQPDSPVRHTDEKVRHADSLPYLGTLHEPSNEPSMNPLRAREGILDGGSPPVEDKTPAPKPRRDTKRENTAEAKALPLPGALDTDRFRAAWTEWIDYRQARASPLTAPSFARQLTRLAEIGHDNAIACIDTSIANGYQGLFPERFAGNGNAQRPGSGHHRPAGNPAPAARNGWDDADNHPVRRPRIPGLDPDAVDADDLRAGADRPRPGSGRPSVPVGGLPTAGAAGG